MSEEILSTAPASAEARHAAIRAFVEHRYPGRRVTEIDESVRSSYALGLAPGSHALAKLDITYEVKAQSVNPTEPSVHCRLLLDEHGELRVLDAAFVTDY